MDAPKYSLPVLRKARQAVADIIILDLQYFGADLSKPGLHMRDIAELVEEKILRTKQDYKQFFEAADACSVELEREWKELYKSRVRAVTSILQIFRETTITEEVLRDIGIHISGYIEELRKGTLYVPWDGYGEVWAPVYVLDVRRIYSKKRKKFYAVKMRSLGGVTACNEWTSIMSAGFIQRLIREGGCRKYDKYIPEDLSGMYMTCLLGNSSRGVTYIDTTYSSSQQNHNKKLQKAREAKCRGPFKPYRGGPCIMCPVGRGNCPLARLQHPFVKRECINGHQGYFDPEKEAIFCLTCLMSGKTKMEQ